MGFKLKQEANSSKYRLMGENVSSPRHCGNPGTISPSVYVVFHFFHQYLAILCMQFFFLRYIFSLDILVFLLQW